MMSTRKGNITAFIAGLLLTFAFHGLTSPDSANAQALPLQVSPARQEITVNPGDSATIPLRFYNLADFPVSGYIRVADFIVNDNDGTPVLVEDSSQVSPRFSGSQWVTLPYERMSIAARDQVSVQATINIPASARPGGRYVAVYYQPAVNVDVNPETGEQAAAAVEQRIAALVYIKVNGAVTEKALVSRLFAPTLLEYGPISFEADVLNKGDYHIRPRGSITLKNMANGYVDQKVIAEKNIFPDTLRTYKDSIGSKWMFGKYTVEFVAAYGSTGQAITRSIDVWVFPWKVALIILLAILILFYGGRTMYRRLIVKENMLESQLKREHEEINKLKDELNKKNS